MTTDIPIHYINATKKTDFEVVVFTKNFNVSTPAVYYAAWRKLVCETEVKFNYPVEMSIAATYQEGDMTIIAGPFPAKLGSTWDITQDTVDTAATLKEKTGVAPNPNNTIVIKNNKPPTWSGRKFDVGIYKSGKLLLVEKDAHIGMQVNFELQPKLYFGVVRNKITTDVFQSLDIMSTLQEYDLSNYPSGIEVTLKEDPGQGEQFVFSASQLSPGSS